MKIVIGEKEYEIDIERAKELGICKESHKKITSINVGDVFYSPGGSISNVLIVQCGWCAVDHLQRYSFAGYDGLKNFSTFGEQGVIESKVLDYLNKHEMVFLKNINDELKVLIR